MSLKSILKHPVATIALFEFYESIRNRWLLVYALAIFVFGYLILYFGGGNSLQTHASLLSLVLLIVPLFSLVYSSISLTESLPFVEMLAAQPLTRATIFTGKWLGLSMALNSGMLVGLILLVLSAYWLENRSWIFLLMLLSVLLTLSFVSFSFLLVNLMKRKESLLGTVLGIWFYFYLLYDLLILGMATMFGDFPLEIPLIAMVCLNPVDLVRILSMLNMEISNLMGYTGAVFRNFFGNVLGMIVGFISFGLWILIPFYIGMKKFEKRDF